MRTALYQFLSFAAVGAIGTAAQYGVLVLLVERAGMSPVLASGCGFAAGAVVNYYLNYKFTFTSTRQHREAAPRFAAVALAGALINTALMYAALRSLHVHYLLLQVVVTGIVLLFNFGANRLWTFAEPQRAPDS
jgi:putative flippase GtrA